MNSNLLKYTTIAFLLLTFPLGCDRNSRRDAPPGAEEEALLAPDKRMKMPDFILAVHNGKPVSSESFQGRVTLVVFFTPSCSACAQEMVMLQNFLGEYPADRFSVIGMAVVDRGSEGTLEKFVTKLGLGFPVLVSNDAVRKGFGGISTAPTAFLVDQNGYIARKFLSHLEKSRLTDSVALLLQELRRPEL